MQRTYDDNVKLWKEAYTEVYAACQKYAIEFDKKYGLYDIQTMLRAAEERLRAIELYEVHGIRLPELRFNPEWTKFDGYRAIGRYDQSSRKISWPDDGKQPDNETLYSIGFPTGGYIFGGHYPKEIFVEFFQELKSYGPKYCDSHNSYLYFSLDNAKAVHNAFGDILDKYRKKDREQAARRRIKELKSELEKLESSS
jgi:hypothetical protein